MRYSSHGLPSALSDENRKDGGKAPKHMNWDACDCDIFCFAKSNKSRPCRYSLHRCLSSGPQVGDLATQSGVCSECCTSRASREQGAASSWGGKAGLLPWTSTLRQEAHFHWQLLYPADLKLKSLSEHVARGGNKAGLAAGSHLAPIAESNSLLCSCCQRF